MFCRIPVLISYLPFEHSLSISLAPKSHSYISFFSKFSILLLVSEELWSVRRKAHRPGGHKTCGDYSMFMSVQFAHMAKRTKEHAQQKLAVISNAGPAGRQFGAAGVRLQQLRRVNRSQGAGCEGTGRGRGDDAHSSSGKQAGADEAVAAAAISPLQDGGQARV